MGISVKAESLGLGPGKRRYDARRSGDQRGRRNRADAATTARTAANLALDLHGSLRKGRIIRPQKRTKKDARWGGRRKEAAGGAAAAPEGRSEPGSWSSGLPFAAASPGPRNRPRAKRARSGQRLVGRRHRAAAATTARTATNFGFDLHDYLHGRPKHPAAKAGRERKTPERALRPRDQWWSATCRHNREDRREPWSWPSWLSP